MKALDCPCVGLDGECTDCVGVDCGEYIKNPVVYAAFVAWLEEPAYDGRENGGHLNTRTTLVAEVAFQAGYDFAKENGHGFGR